jgi:hypothetical protein
MRPSLLRNALQTLAVLAALAVAGGAAADTVTREIDRTFRLEPGGQVVLENVNGHIEVEAWDQHRVELHVVKKTKAGDRDRAEEAMEAFEIDIESTPERLSVIARRPRDANGGFLSWLRGWEVQYEASYRLKVPRRVDLRADTVNGHVEVAGVEGALDVETVNGRASLDRVAGHVDVSTVNGSVEVADSRGSVSASTVNGSIRVGLTEVANDADMRFSTTNGSVRLSLPPDVQAELDARSTNGGISCDFPVEIHGKYNRKSIRAALNGGGPGRLEVRTTNGGISIQEM